MKIAVISDIHGNMEALEAVIDEIQRNECEKIFVLGDYAMAGPEPKQTVDFFMRRENDPSFVMIQGNTDLMIADYNYELYEKLKVNAPIMAEALRNDYKLLNVFEKSFLKNLPVQKEIEIEGVSFLLVHGSPRKNNEDILPDTPMKDVVEMLQNVEANVVLCGHTHLPCGFQTETKQTVINVGSVGRPFTPEPKSCYLIVTVENGKCIFEHNFVEYNNKAASEKLRKRDFDGSGDLASMLLNPTKRHF